MLLPTRSGFYSVLPPQPISYYRHNIIQPHSIAGNMGFHYGVWSAGGHVLVLRVFGIAYKWEQTCTLSTFGLQCRKDTVPFHTCIRIDPLTFRMKTPSYRLRTIGLATGKGSEPVVPLHAVGQSMLGTLPHGSRTDDACTW